LDSFLEKQKRREDNEEEGKIDFLVCKRERKP
jgi:hypothetical protein